MLLALGACRGEPDPSSLPAAERAYLNLGPEATYVGAETCRTCHPAQYETFMQSEMGRSFRAATLSNSDASWEGIEPVYDAERDLYYLPFHRGEDLFVMEYRLAGRDTVHRRVEQIDFIVGSGHHTNSHMREENGYVYQIPVTWYVEDGRWDLPPGFDHNRDSRFRRPITEACMTCHNALPGFVEGSENKFDHVPLGIDCERCHGPGSVHVEAKRTGEVVDVSEEIDYTIVNPGKLPPERQLDVCQRCHMQGTGTFREGRGPADFRPGMRLDAVLNVFEVREADSTARFRMAAHPDRLRMSACFQATHEPESPFEPMTCITCHDPHVPVKTLDYNESCRSCHATVLGDNLESGSEDIGAAKASACTEPEVVHATAPTDCVACHMSTSGSWDIPHITITDHFIRVPAEAIPTPALTTAEVEARRQMVRLASLIAANPSNREVAEGFMEHYETVTNRPRLLDSAAVRLERGRAEEPLQALAPSLIRLGFLRGDHAAVRTLASQIDTGALDAWALYRIGEAFTRSGEYEAAIRYLRRAVDAAPFHLRFRKELASAYADAGQLLAAVAAYDALLAEDPTFEDAYNDRGFAHLLLGDLVAAEADFRAALRLDSDLEMALANLASLYFNTERADEARPYAERLVRLFPEKARYRQFLETVEKAGR
ncbi:MAG: tetratricopeptide repeat protein [Rhodothermales bacterium]